MYLKKAVSNLSLINIIIFLETAFSFEKKKIIFFCGNPHLKLREHYE
jgi:hypothetical protein